MSLIREELQVTSEDAGSRLDKWLTSSLQDNDYEVSRSQIQQWIDDGYVTGSRTRVKASDPVAESEVYTIDVPNREPLSLAGDDVPFDIVYDDEEVVVVDKPRGVVVHPAAGHPRGTLVNGLLHRGITLSAQGGSVRPGVVHRIDKDTSGLLVFAKTDVAYLKLAEQLKEHTMHRVYQAIVHGVLTHDEGLIDAPIGRDPRNRQRMAVHERGKHAITHFRVLERFSDYTYVELKLETGRTHQIRVHMAYIGHPLAGDPLYGRRHTLSLDGQALHAMELGFVHPRTGEFLMFHSDLPQDMKNALSVLKSE